MSATSPTDLTELITNLLPTVYLVGLQSTVDGRRGASGATAGRGAARVTNVGRAPAPTPVPSTAELPARARPYSGWRAPTRVQVSRTRTL